ncbi:CAP domain-containing protein [Actinomyces trachealis]|uniref:CAP domain-containing protein n=1 Tax=Actinomyces trachealis TaxID=2763540 RepID=UPI0018929729|nr:CAP domain-containing protein [Actinomyces trachealis]
MSTNIRPVLLAAGLTTGAVLLLPSTANAEEASPVLETGAKVTTTEAAATASATSSTEATAPVGTDAPKSSGANSTDATALEAVPGAIEIANESSTGSTTPEATPAMTAANADAAADAAEVSASDAEAAAKQTLSEAQNAAQDAANAAAGINASTSALAEAKKQVEAADAAAATVDPKAYEQALKAEAQAADADRDAKQAQAAAAKQAADTAAAKTAAEKKALAAKTEQQAAASAKPQAEAQAVAAKKELSAAVAARDELTTNANAATRKAQADLAAAKEATARIAGQISTDKSELDKAKAANQQAGAKKSLADAVVATAQAAHKKAVEADTAAKQAALEAASKETEAVEALKQANSSFSAAKKAVASAETAVAAARDVLVAKNGAVTRADVAVSNAERAAQEAAAEYNKGTVGFFESVGATDAVAALTTSTAGEGGTAYREASFLGAAGDATDLESMRKALEAIRYANEFRAKEGLPPYKVSHNLMAAAQIYANWTSSKNDLVHHEGVKVDSEQYMQAEGENLAGGHNGLGAVEAWYAEKRIWDQAVKDGVVTEADKANAYKVFTEHEDLYYRVGHYLNLVMPWDGTATGMGISDVPGHYRAVAGEYARKDSPASAGAQDLDTYEKAFLSYYNRVKAAKDSGAAKIQAAKDQAAAARAAAQAAQKTLDAANMTLLSRSEDQAQAAGRVRAAQVALTAASTARRDATEYMKTTGKAVNESFQDLENKKLMADQAARRRADAQAAQVAATKALADHQQQLVTAQTAEAAAAQRLDQILTGQGLKAAQDRVTNAEKALAKARAAADAATRRLMAATAAVADAKAAVQAATQQAGAATAAKVEADQAVTAAAATLAQAKAKVAPMRQLVEGPKAARSAMAAIEADLAANQTRFADVLARLVSATGDATLAKADAAKLSAVAMELATVTHEQSLANGFTLKQYPVLVEAYQFAKVSRETAQALRAMADRLAVEESTKTGAAAEVVVDGAGRTHLKVPTPYKARHLAEPRTQGRELARTGADSLDLLPLAAGMVLAGVALRRREERA